MPWKAWLEGHEFDLETLRELFRAGDPLVAQDPLDGYYLESSVLRIQMASSTIAQPNRW